MIDYFLQWKKHAELFHRDTRAWQWPVEWNVLEAPPDHPPVIHEGVRPCTLTSNIKIQYCPPKWKVDIVPNTHLVGVILTATSKVRTLWFCQNCIEEFFERTGMVRSPRKVAFPRRKHGRAFGESGSWNVVETIPKPRPFREHCKYNWKINAPIISWAKNSSQERFLSTFLQSSRNFYGYWNLFSACLRITHPSSFIACHSMAPLLLMVVRNMLLYILMYLQLLFILCLPGFVKCKWSHLGYILENPWPVQPWQFVPGSWLSSQWSLPGFF